MATSIAEISSTSEIPGRRPWNPDEEADWLARGRELAKSHVNNQWKIANWLAEAQRRSMWPETQFTEAEELFGVSKSTLYRMSQVAKAFPDSRRRENPTWEKLTWSHFVEVAPIDDSTAQARLLTEAASGDDLRWPVWPITHLRSRAQDVIRKEKKKEPKTPTPKPGPDTYAIFEKPVVNGSRNSQRIRVIFSNEEFTFLVKLAKVRKQKKPGELVRALLSEMAKAHLGKWKREIAASSKPKRIQTTKRKKVAR
jgi:hypothetical protein